MREILFRGKRVDTGEWAYGYYWKDHNGKHGITYLGDDNFFNAEVIPETVGQFTGLTESKNHPMFDDKIKLFEDDIFQVGNLKTKYRVVFENYEWIGVSNDGDNWGKFEYKLSAIGKSPVHIIGNIHDNPELL